MYSEIWLPDLLDSAKWLNSRFSILLNWNEKGEMLDPKIHNGQIAFYEEVTINCSVTIIVLST